MNRHENAFVYSQLDNETTCVNFTVERWLPVANMSRYLPIRVYDYYAPGEILSRALLKEFNNDLFMFLERFNETIFDSLPTYLLNICEVCGSSQCPYCSIYNAAFKSTISLVLIFTSVSMVIFRNFRIGNNINWIPPWNVGL